jgi:threonine dehydrogenase-like Zn-dependent dehydrogenase
MKAAFVEGPNKLVVRDLPKPRPGAYEMLVELLFGATCSGTDSHIVECNFPFPSKLPTLLGHESIGRVIEIGPKVRNFAVGDLLTRVGMPATEEYSITWGGFAEYGIAKDHFAMEEEGIPRSEWDWHRCTNKLPPDTDPAAATMFITWRETLSYCKRMGFGEGKSVAILGTGGNGIAYVAHARNLGASQITAIGAPNREEIARHAGATDFVSYKSEDTQAQAVACCKDGYDFVIDAVGKIGMADTALALLRPGGTIGIYGIDDYGKVTFNPMAAAGTFTVYKGGYDQSEAHEEVTSFHREGKLDASIWLNLNAPYDLENINDAFDAIRSRRELKALVRLRG